MMMAFHFVWLPAESRASLPTIPWVVMPKMRGPSQPQPTMAFQGFIATPRPPVKAERMHVPSTQIMSKIRGPWGLFFFDRADEPKLEGITDRTQQTK